MTVLTPKDRTEAYHLRFKKEVPVKDIAARYGVDPARIYQITAAMRSQYQENAARARAARAAKARQRAADHITASAESDPGFSKDSLKIIPSGTAKSRSLTEENAERKSNGQDSKPLYPLGYEEPQPLKSASLAEALAILLKEKSRIDARVESLMKELNKLLM